MARPQVAPQPWSSVQAVLASEGLGVLAGTGGQRQIAAQFIAGLSYLSGNLMLHARAVAQMREHGATRIVTRDADFGRFAGIEVLDPVASSSVYGPIGGRVRRYWGSIPFALAPIRSPICSTIRLPTSAEACLSGVFPPMPSGPLICRSSAVASPRRRNASRSARPG